MDERRSNVNLINERNKINFIPKSTKNFFFIHATSTDKLFNVKKAKGFSLLDNKVTSNTTKKFFFKTNKILNKLYYFKKTKFFYMLDKKPFKNLLKLNSVNIFSQTYSNFEETNRNIKNNYSIKSPVSLVKLNKKNLNNLFLIKFRYSDQNSIYNHKVSAASSYLCFKQKRYKRRNVITPININYKNYHKNKVNFCGSINLKNNYNIQSSSHKNISEKCVDLTRYHRLIRKSRARNDKMNVFTSKRLLRVKKTLVLPTHINITAITNSYDVVHS